ncbi:hypothetical protein AALO_G00005000 [Alosa alosa]|uniref:Uncharacterized protein n=1 Tax=Alosa alosa TaxID=278164 RepID=A0AAV6HGH6_9TELE|nr:hypothetical protein AALO_G00005000 [Alosa alosa]
MSQPEGRGGGASSSLPKQSEHWSAAEQDCTRSAWRSYGMKPACSGLPLAHLLTWEGEGATTDTLDTVVVGCLAHTSEWGEYWERPTGSLLAGHFRVSL